MPSAKISTPSMLHNKNCIGRNANRPMLRRAKGQMLLTNTCGMRYLSRNTVSSKSSVLYIMFRTTNTDLLYSSPNKSLFKHLETLLISTSGFGTRPKPSLTIQLFGLSSPSMSHFSSRTHVMPCTSRAVPRKPFSTHQIISACYSARSLSTLSLVSQYADGFRRLS